VNTHLDPDVPTALTAPAEIPEDTAAAAGGGFAAVIDAKLKKLAADKTKEFKVPGWDGDLVLRARKVTDEERAQADDTVKTIALATDAVLLRKTPDGPLEELPAGWLALRREMGRDDLTMSDVIAIVLDNPVRVDVFAQKIIAWMIGEQDKLEQLLGE